MLASADRQHIRKSEKRQKRKSVLQRTEAGQCGRITVDSFVNKAKESRDVCVTGEHITLSIQAETAGLDPGHELRGVDGVDVAHRSV
ncbi:TPA: hypothetical protein BOS_4239 [Bos taurus]|nr:TPA: hypothetical protein BOS_4239 [Bos taurus]